MVTSGKLALVAICISLIGFGSAYGYELETAPSRIPHAVVLRYYRDTGTLRTATHRMTMSSSLPEFRLTTTIHPPLHTPVIRRMSAIPSPVKLTLEYPQWIRSGDSEVMRLTLAVDTFGLETPSAELIANINESHQQQVADVFNTYDVIAEARLDLVGPDIEPTEIVSEPLLPDQSVTFYWTIHPAQTGIYRGTVWLYLRFIDKVSRKETLKPISAQTIEIQARNFFGLNGNFARIAGCLGLLVSVALGFPFKSTVLKWQLEKIRHG